MTTMALAPAPASGTRRVLPRGRADRDLLLLAAVAVVYFLAQLALVPPWIFVEGDEAIYVSQFAADVPAAYMSEPRAYGIPLLIAPVAAVTDSMIAFHLYMGLVCAAGVLLGFLPWLRIMPGVTVPLAALLFCSLWPALFHAGQVGPNTPTACCTVAAVGWFLRALDEPRRERLAALAAAFAAMALIRPTDTVWVAVPLAAVALLRGSGGTRRVLAAVAVGSAVGWLPWTVEAQIRFGGLFERMHRIDFINSAGWQWSVGRQLASFGVGRTYCPPYQADCGDAGFGSVLLWSLVPLLAGLGLWRARTSASFAPPAVAAGVGTACLLPYFFYLGIGAPRFLLPGLALLVLPVAAGLRSLGSQGTDVRAVLAVLLAVHVAAQGWIVMDVAEAKTAGRGKVPLVARVLKRNGIGSDCFVYANGYMAAPLGVALRCRSLGDRALRKLQPNEAAVRRMLQDEARRGVAVAAVVDGQTGDVVPGGWRRIPVRSVPGTSVYLPPRG